MNVCAEVRYDGERAWRPLAHGTVNQTGLTDEAASTFSSRREAEDTIDGLAEALPEWWDGVAEWRVVDVV